MATNAKGQSLLLYQLAMDRVNKYFQDYYHSPDKKILNFTSKQMRYFPNLIKFYQDGPDTSSGFGHLTPDSFEEMFHNVQLLERIKVSCKEEFITELQYFHSLEHIHIVGPFLHAISGLRQASSNLKTLIIENGSITLHELLSVCCMDESRPMSWPRLLSLKVSNCSLLALDPSLKLLPNLLELDLSFNQLHTTGNELSFLNHLTHLNLSFNHLTEMPQFDGGILWQLQYLYLSFNEISNLDGIQVLEYLLELDLSHNILIHHDALQPLRHLGKLGKLDLRQNPICQDKKHRCLSLKSISPQSLCHEFLLDGKYLTEGDLKNASYTPLAVSIHQHSFRSVRAHVSINSVEPESYDVSMSPTAEPHGRPLEGDYFKLCSKRLMQKRITSKRAVAKNMSPSYPITSNADRRFSVSSEFDNKSDDQSSLEPQDSPTEQEPVDLNKRKATGEYLTVVSTHSTSSEKAIDDHPIVDRSITEDQDDSHANNRTEALADMGEIVTLSLHAKRSIHTRFGATLIGPEEINVTLTPTHLIEIDIDSGKVWEQLELCTVVNVSLSKQEIPILDVKFSYLRKDRRNRQYTIVKDEHFESLDRLFRELENVALRNLRDCNQQLTCLKCARNISVPPNSKRNSMQLDPASRNNSLSDPSGIVCSCGSNLVVQTDRQRSSEDECQEVTEESKVDDMIMQKSDESNSVEMGRPADAADVSLSWMHSLQSVTAAGSFSQRALNRSSEAESHLSESLPSDLYAVSLRPHETSGLRSALSSSVVSESQRPAAIKNFSHLLTAHDLYKLVDVTPSITAAKSKTATAIDPTGEAVESMMVSSLREQASRQGDSVEFASTQAVVTSTPRKRTFSPKVGRVRPGDRKLIADGRMLDFEGHNASDKGRDAEHEIPRRTEEADTRDSDNRRFFKLTQELKRFVEEELMEVGEEMCAAERCSMHRSSGGDLVNLSYASSAGKNERPFKRNNSLTLLASPTAKYLPDESDVLLVLTTANVHILKVNEIRDSPKPEDLECVASHSLENVICVDFGLSNLTLFFATGTSTAGDLSRRKKFTTESVDQVYALHFRDREKCQNFYVRWAGVPNPSDDAIPACLASPFSDFLEKNLSEHVLIEMDMDVPDPASKRLSSTRMILTKELYVYTPCWMLEDDTSKQIPVGVVLSCGGSLRVVEERLGFVMYQFTSAIVRSERIKLATPPSRPSLQIPQHAIATVDDACYVVKKSSECHSVKSVERYANDVKRVTLNLGDKKCGHSWDLTFPDDASLADALARVEAYRKLQSSSDLISVWN